MEILFISAWFPFPQDNGARIRVYQLLRALGRRHRVHLVAFLPPAEERRYLDSAGELCTSVRVVERDPFWRDPKQRLWGHFSLTPRDVLRGYSAEMTAIVEKLVVQKRFEVVIASTLEAAPYALKVKSTPRLLEEHNFTTLWMNERFQASRGLLKRIAGWVTLQKCLHYERQLYTHFRAVSMVSERDRQAVLKNIPDYPGCVEMIPNGVDLETRQFGLAAPVADTIVFNGSLTYAANLEAMQFFVSQVWPVIRGERPGVRLRITGRTDGVELGWLQGEAGIELTGYLEDVRPAVAESWLSIAPLRSGSGTRLKILEAMALGAPVVATHKGAEGLEVTPGKDILIADEPYDFAWQCLNLLENARLRQEIAAQARALVEAKYGWEAIGEKFCALVEETAVQSACNERLPRKDRSQ